MEKVESQYARLGHALKDAYDNWTRKSEACGSGGSMAAPRDVSGCSEAAQLEWFAYLAAKQRLVWAYAARPEDAGNDQ